MIALAIVVLFGSDKLPEIARGLGEGVRKMRGAVDDIKTEIMKEADNPLSEIKKEIENVKKSAQDFNPLADDGTKTFVNEEIPKQNLSEDDSHEGPVSRQRMNGLIEKDHQLLLFLNGLGDSAFDPFWLTVTGKWFWIPFYIILLYLFYNNILPF